MRPFRKIILSAAVTLSAFSAVLYAGCKDKCGSTTCQNGGTCSDNTCVCPTGYSGSDCSTAWTTPYIGTYNCRYTSGGTSSATWQSVITTDVSNAGYAIDITNFSNSNIVVVATVDSLINGVSNMLIVPSADSSGVTGTGKYSTQTNSNGEIKVTYNTVSGVNGSAGAHYTFVMDKQ